MESLPKCYIVLFNAVTEALKALEEQDYEKTMILLVRGQMDAEDAYIDDE